MLWGDYRPSGESSAVGLALGFLFWCAPPLIVAIGSYAHVVKHRRWGQVVIWASGTFMAFLLGIMLFMLLYYRGGIGAANLAPGALALLTLLTALTVSGQEKTE